jgi:predicted dehydrogenase
MTGVAEPVGVGVIGARSMVATRAVMPAIDASNAARLVAVSSLGGPVPEPWGRLDAGSYDDVLHHPDVEAVYIPLPNGMHRDWVERAAAAGKHVLCEKPLAPTVADAEAMAAACDAAGVMLVEAWMTPFDARWRAAIDTAKRGVLGSVLDIDASFTFTIGADADGNYRWSPNQGGGALLDVGIYCLGPIVELWGPHPDVIDATALWHPTGVDSRTEATLSWADGREARIRCSFVDAEEQRIEIIGVEASLIIAADAHTGGERASGFLVARSDGRATTEPVTASNP